MNKLLACTAFATIGLFASPGFASEPEPSAPAPRCRVGNGKSATYMDGVARCTMARATGTDKAATAATTTTTATTAAPAPAQVQEQVQQPKPRPAKQPRRQARATGSR